MKLYRHTISSAQNASEDAVDIKVWGPRAIATVLWEIGSQFELSSGHQLDIDSALADSYLDRIELGERFDVGGVSSNTRALCASQKLLGFLRGQIAASVIRSQGMEPASDR